MSGVEQEGWAHTSEKKTPPPPPQSGGRISKVLSGMAPTVQLSLSNSSAGGRNNSQGSEQTVQGVASVASNQPSAESYSGPI